MKMNPQQAKTVSVTVIATLTTIVLLSIAFLYAPVNPSRELIFKAGNRFALMLKSQGRLGEYLKTLDDHVLDEILITELKDLDEDSAVLNWLETGLRRRDAPFEKMTGTYYDLESPELLKAIEELPENSGLRKELRQLARDHAKPFESRATPVELGFPRINIPDNRAAVCQYSEFFREEIIISTEDQSNRIRVRADEIGLCPGDAAPDTAKTLLLIQVNHRMARALFGCVDLRMKEPALAQLVAARQENIRTSTIPNCDQQS